MGDKTAVIYARVSSTGERQSTERQVKDLSDYALYKQMDVRKVFEEHISGAKKNEERPVLCEAIDYCKEHRISTLLVSELSRMGRNAFEVLASVKELIDCGINLYIQKKQFNPNRSLEKFTVIMTQEGLIYSLYRMRLLNLRA